MQPMRRMTVSELAAEHLRTGLQSGRWSGTLPGVARLARDLDVSRHTVRAALWQLETEGLLSGRGLGRSRGITAFGANTTAQRALRVVILRHDARLTDNSQTSGVLIEIMHLLEAAGHTVSCEKSQVGLRHDVRRIIRELEKEPADARIIEAGSYSLLEWCAQQSTPCLALYGRPEGLPMADTGPDKVPAYRAAIRLLLEFGHRRIVYVVRSTRRLPTPGVPECAFLEELASGGVATGDYNLPSWEETPEGFSSMLERLFMHSPPTALILDEVSCYIAAAEFLARRGIRVPEQVSLVLTDDDPALAWCRPQVAHIRWDSKPVIRHVARWVEAVRKGKSDRRSIGFPAEFIPGGSIGPVWKG
jgi:DNA-binding LacI/PurR family transcriptional regulator